jgi:hypothetical protein
MRKTVRRVVDLFFIVVGSLVALLAPICAFAVIPEFLTRFCWIIAFL